MNDAISTGTAGSSSAPAAGSNATSAEANSPLVVFANAPGAPLSDAPPSEWGFAAQESAPSGKPIDSLRGPEEGELVPVIAAATMLIIAQADPQADDGDALVALTRSSPGPQTQGEILAAAAIADDATVMWSGEAMAATRIGAEHVIVYMPHETALAHHDIGGHGISLDWTDYSLPSLG